MRLRLLAAAIAVFASSLAAHADTFVFTPSGGSSITFKLTGQTIHSDGYDAVYATDNPEIAKVDFFSNAYGNMVQQYGFGNLILNLEVPSGQNYGLDGVQLYTGPESAPVFALGTYNLTSDPVIGHGDGTLVIADDSVALTPVATAATPEPSSLALLGTSLLGLAAIARRRFA